MYFLKLSCQVLGFNHNVKKIIRKRKQYYSLSYKTQTVLQIKFPFPMLICSETLMKPYKCLFVLASSTNKKHSGMLILQKCCKALVFLKKNQKQDIYNYKSQNVLLHYLATTGFTASSAEMFSIHL